MIEQALCWLGENAIPVSAFGIAIIVIGLIIYVAHDLPAPPIDDDDDQSGWGV